MSKGVLVTTPVQVVMIRPVSQLEDYASCLLPFRMTWRASSGMR